MAYRLPGAGNLDEYWRLINSAASAIVELPAHRFNRELYYAPEKGVLGKSYSTLGGIVPERPLDRRLFPQGDELAAACDPAHLTLLDVAASAFLDAGIDPAAMARSNTGVYIGHARGSPLAGDLAYATHVEEIASELEILPAFAQLSQDQRNQVGACIVDQVRREKPRRREGG